MLSTYSWSSQYNLGIITLSSRLNKDTKVAVYNYYRLATYVPFYINSYSVVPYPDYD